MPHVDDGTLHALLDGALRAHEPDRADRVEAHLDTCADCRSRFQEAAALRDRAADVLGALDAGLAPEGATGAAGPGSTEPAPDFQDVLARVSVRRRDEEPEAGPETGSAMPVDGDTARAGSIRRRYQWTRGLAWAATIVVALGTGYLVRDLAGPTGVVPPARSALEQDARGAAEPDGAPDASASDELEAEGLESGASAIGQEAAPTRAGAGEQAAAEAVTGEPTGAGTQLGDAAKAVPEAGERRADVTAPSEERERVAADAPAPAAADDETAEAVTGTAVETLWRTASLEEAEARVGAVLRLPTASIASVELGPDGSVRTRQLLGEGVEVELLQEVQETTARAAMDAAPAEDQTGRQRAEAQVAEAMAPSAAVPSLMELDLDSAAATVEAPVTVSVARDGYVLTLTGALPEDVLRALAATASPRTP